jgi:hypothetical protein
MKIALIAAILMLVGIPIAATADPDKDESKQSNEKYSEDYKDWDWDKYDRDVQDKSRRERSSPYFRGRYSRLDIPYGQYPPPGECRVWFPERPPGQQPPPEDCRAIRSVPRGAWLIRRPHDDEGHVYVNARSDVERTIMDVIGIFDIATGGLVRELEGR